MVDRCNLATLPHKRRPNLVKVQVILEQQTPQNPNEVRAPTAVWFARAVTCAVFLKVFACRPGGEGAIGRNKATTLTTAIGGLFPDG